MEKTKVYVGIDPGAKGCITLLNGNIMMHYSLLNRSKQEIADHLIRIKNSESMEPFVVMELVHSIYGSSAKATFSFGEIFGFLQGLLSALKIPYELVQPKDWQKEIWNTDDKVYKAEGGKKLINTKATSLNAAERLFPGHKWARTERCSTVDDNVVDSSLIALYGRRRNL